MTKEIVAKLDADFKASNFQSDALHAALQAMAYYGTEPAQMAVVGSLHQAALRKTADTFKAAEFAKRDLP